MKFLAAAKKNLNASEPSNKSKGLGGIIIIGYSDKSSTTLVHGIDKRVPQCHV